MNIDLAAMLIGFLSLGIYAAFRIWLAVKRRRDRTAIRAAYEQKEGAQDDD